MKVLETLSRGMQVKIGTQSFSQNFSHQPFDIYLLGPYFEHCFVRNDISFGHCLNAHLFYVFSCPHTGLLIGQGKPSKQNHMAETKEEELSNGWWLQKLKAWTAGFPFKWMPSCLSPWCPPFPWPEPSPPDRVPQALTDWLGQLAQKELCCIGGCACRVLCPEKLSPDLKSISDPPSGCGAAQSEL